jgi:hypothetical protein
MVKLLRLQYEREIDFLGFKFLSKVHIIGTIWGRLFASLFSFQSLKMCFQYWTCITKNRFHRNTIKVENIDFP